MNIKEVLITPIKALRPRYVPLLMIYFAYGASGFSGIAESFFVKERLNISAHGLLVIGVWLTIPWTIKMVFGQLVDSVPLFKSRRRIYIFIAAGLMAIGSLLLTGLAAKTPWLMNSGHPNQIYFVASLISIIGIVLQDVVADAMSVEVVDREGRDEKAVAHDLAMVQLLGRLVLSIGIFIVAGLGGWLAHHVSYTTMFLLSLIIPCISVTGCLLVKIDTSPRQPIKPYILYGGILYAIIVSVLGMLDFPYAQEIIFVFSLLVVCFFLSRIMKGLKKKVMHNMLKAALVIFFFRAMPSVGPGLQWWQIDTLHFSKAFFGTLGQIGAGLSIAGMWLFAKPITEKPIGLVFLVLIIVGFILSLPVLGMYYGLHNWTEVVLGFGAHTIALVDTALASPFAQLSMVPMLALTAIYAPKGNAGTWFALMASLMNLALNAGAIGSKLLNKVWVVNRAITDANGHITQPANYQHLGALLWIVIISGLVIPAAVIIICRPRDLGIGRNKKS